MDALSVWRSPIDQVALDAARNLAARQPRCDKTIDQLPPDLNPSSQDLVPLWRQQDNITVGASLQTLATFFGSSVGFQFNTDLSALGVYNYGAFVQNPGGTAAHNNAALQNMFTAINAAGTNPSSIGGGWVWIPQYSFQVTGTLNTSTAPGGYIVPNQTTWLGLGGGGSGGGTPGGAHFIINSLALPSTFLSITGPHSSGGVELRNIAFQWHNALFPSDTAVYLGTWNGVLYRCTFTNVPCAANIGGYSNFQSGLQCCVDKCQIQYDSGPAGATMFVLGGEQAQILGPSEFIQQGEGTGGPLRCTLIAIGGGVFGAENQHISRLHIANWNIGIDYADTNNAFVGEHSGCQRTTVDGNEFQCWQTCINMTTYSNTGSIYTQKIIGNKMLKAQNSTDGHAIFLIDNGAMGPGGVAGDNSLVSSIDLIGNDIYSNVTQDSGHNGIAQNGQYGLQINGGQGIRVIGGKISNVGTNTGSDGTANIAITGVNGSGGPHTTQIIGVNLRPTMSNVGSGGTGAGPSQWALLVTANLTGGNSTVEVRDCNMGGFTGSPVQVTGTISTGGLFITNCLGYNDQNTPIMTPSGTAVPLLPTSASNAALRSGTNYFGPSLLYFSTGASGVTFTWNGVPNTVAANSSQYIYISSPYHTIQFSGSVGQFVWVGA